MSLTIKNGQGNEALIKGFAEGDFIFYEGKVFQIHERKDEVSPEEVTPEEMSVVTNPPRKYNVIDISTGRQEELDLDLVLKYINDSENRDTYLIKEAEFVILASNK